MTKSKYGVSTRINGERNPEYDRLHNEEWRKTHPNRSHGDVKGWKKNNHERVLDRQREWKKNNPGSAREYTWRCHGVVGLTWGIYLQALVDQGYRCAICGDTVNQKSPADHDRKTGIFRGVLCQPCNKLLGSARDSEMILENAIVYLAYNRRQEEGTGDDDDE